MLKSQTAPHEACGADEQLIFARRTASGTTSEDLLFIPARGRDLRRYYLQLSSFFLCVLCASVAILLLYFGCGYAGL